MIFNLKKNNMMIAITKKQYNRMNNKFEYKIENQLINY